MNTEKQIINILLDDIYDGNKRTAIHSMLIYLYINDILLDYESIELENIIINIASSKMSCEELTQWLQDHVKKI